MAEYFRPTDLPTAEEYIAAFRKINMTENRLAVLRAQYESPRHTARATDIAEDTGLLPHQTVNLIYDLDPRSWLRS